MKRTLSVPTSETALPPLRWDPSGKKLAYFQGDWRKGRLLVIEPDSEKAPVVIKDPLSATCDFCWAPDSKHIAITTASESGIVTIASVDGINSSTIKVREPGKIESLAWSPDGRTILASARGEDDEFFKLFAIEPDTGTVSIAAEGLGDIRTAVWLPDGKSFIYHILADGIVRAVLKDREHAKVIGPTNGVLYVTHVNPNGQIAYGRFGSLTQPPVLMEIRIAAGEAKVVYAPPRSDKTHCPEPESIRIKSQDGILIPAFHWKASSASGAQSKILIDVHGGLHTQTYPTWESYIQILTKKGWDILAVNYRGSSGYGQKFENMDDEEECAMDVLAARNYAVDALKIPARRVYLMGNSHGSGLVAAVAAHGEEIAGVVLISWARDIDVECCIKTPISIIAAQGTLDPFASPKQARRSIERIFQPAVRLKTQWHAYEDEGHFFYRTDSWARIFSELEQISSP